MAPQSEWLLLSEALSEAFDAADVVRTDAFNDILRSGRVPLRGKRRGHWRADPIEHWLPRIGRISILPISTVNKITLWLDTSSTDERQIAEQFAGNPGVLLPSDSTVTFTDVRVHWPKLVEELAAAGYAVPKAKSLGRPGPKGGDETSVKQLAWEIARNILDDDTKRPPLGHGRSTALARLVNAELAQQGHQYRDDSVRRMGLGLRDWEADHPGK